MAENSPCIHCNTTPREAGANARWLECLCGPCCPEDGFKCKHDYEWVCEDCEDRCYTTNDVCTYTFPDE
ncbi:MAG: hypothetical protein GWO84_07300 [Euryarchaeota archaeon]|nr:hypothetical protein [Euryarchaeota archaeon]